MAKLSRNKGQLQPGNTLRFKIPKQIKVVMYLNLLLNFIILVLLAVR